MGFRFRKSKKIGPFRVTLSKSGISASVGVKGFRVTKTASGRTRMTASIPGTGISYVKETGGAKKSAAKTQRSAAPVQRTEIRPAAEPTQENAVEFASHWQSITVADLQKHFQCSYGAAARFMDSMVELGFVGPLREDGSHAVYVTSPEPEFTPPAMPMQEPSDAQRPRTSRRTVWPWVAVAAAASLLWVIMSCSSAGRQSAAPTLSPTPARSVVTPITTPTPTPTPSPTSKPSLAAVIDDAPEPVPAAEPTPTPESTATSEPTPVAAPYVLNTNTMRFHKPGCSSAADIAPGNRAEVEAVRDDLIAQGYVPCGLCHP